MAYNYQGGGNVSHGEFGSIGDALAGRNRYNIQTAQFDPTRANEERALALGARNQQQELAQAIQNRAMGRGGPSIAELQMQRGLGQAQQAAAQQAAGARGVDRAAAFYQAQNAQANMASDANANAAMLRAQEQIQAQQLGAQNLQGIRGQDIESRGLSTQEQGLQMQAQTAAEAQRNQQAGQNAQNLQKLSGGAVTALGGLIASDIRAKENIVPLSTWGNTASDAPMRPGEKRWGGFASPEEVRTGKWDDTFINNVKAKEAGGVANQQVSAGPRGYERNFETAYPAERPPPTYSENLGGALQGFGAILSDRNSKEQIARLSAALDRAQGRAVARVNEPAAIQSRDNLGPVQPYTYRYKPEVAAAMGTDTGPRLGTMAQDLQRSPAYQAAVVPTPQGLALDKDRLLQANTAELGGVDKRLRELEAAQAGAIRRVNAPVNGEDDEEKLKRALDRAGSKAVKRVQEPVPKVAAR